MSDDRPAVSMGVTDHGDLATMPRELGRWVIPKALNDGTPSRVISQFNHQGVTFLVLSLNGDSSFSVEMADDYEPFTNDQMRVREAAHMASVREALVHVLSGWDIEGDDAAADCADELIEMVTQWVRCHQNVDHRWPWLNAELVPGL